MSEWKICLYFLFHSRCGFIRASGIVFTCICLSTVPCWLSHLHPCMLYMYMDVSFPYIVLFIVKHVAIYSRMVTCIHSGVYNLAI